MPDFKGFGDSETLTSLPDSFFQQLLGGIRAAEELKVTLYALWRIEHMDGPFRALCETDFDDPQLGLTAEARAEGLKQAVARGSLLKAQHESDIFYFLNSPRGRAAAEAFGRGNWRESARIMTAPMERPNVFKVYEDNIGPLTPLIADALKDAQATYSDEWMLEAIEIAVKNNKRSWKYCEAILRRWKEDGTHGKQNAEDPGKGSDRYTKSEFDEYLKRD